LNIRRAKESDIADLVSLENKCFNTYYKEHRFEKKQFIGYLQKKHTIFLVAIINSSLVGYVAGTIRTLKNQSSACLDSIAVLHTSRGRGIGGRLMDRFIRKARRRACKKIMLDVASVNKNGIRFFSRLGFRKTRLLTAHYGAGKDGIRMKLDI